MHETRIEISTDSTDAYARKHKFYSNTAGIVSRLMRMAKREVTYFKKVTLPGNI